MRDVSTKTDLEVVAVHGEVDSERVVQRVEQPDELVLAKVGRGEAVARRHVVRRGGVRVKGVDVGEQRAHLRRHAGTQVLGRQAVKVTAKEREDVTTHNRLHCNAPDEATGMATIMGSTRVLYDLPIMPRPMQALESGCMAWNMSHLM